MNVLHSDNKIPYHEGDRVELTIDGNISSLVKGTIVGLAMVNLIDFWIVRLDKKYPGYKFSCISIQHTFIRPLGDNRPFLCEGVSRV